MNVKDSITQMVITNPTRYNQVLKQSTETGDITEAEVESPLDCEESISTVWILELEQLSTTEREHNLTEITGASNLSEQERLVLQEIVR